MSCDTCRNTPCLCEIFEGNEPKEFPPFVHKDHGLLHGNSVDRFVDAELDEWAVECNDLMVRFWLNGTRQNIYLPTIEDAYRLSDALVNAAMAYEDKNKGIE